MAEFDPLETQRDVAHPVATELSTAGFEDADEIGRGGFGVVYRCWQAALDRTVAVKVLISDLEPENLDRFFREQRAMGRLTGHPNIVNVLQVGITDSGRPFIVMPYNPQSSLEARIRREGPLAWNDALRLGVKMAGALETAHQVGILHRDVKPANILLTQYNEPQLADFGIAHITGGFETATGIVTGSPAFTAPEVLRGRPPTAGSDIYGLGATLFCAVTGHAAFERRRGERLVAQFLRITTQPIPDLREKSLPEDMCAAVERAMAANPDDRPTTAAEFGDELRQVQRCNGYPVDEMAVHTTAGTKHGAQHHLAENPTPADATPDRPHPATSGEGENPQQTLTPEAVHEPDYARAHNVPMPVPTRSTVGNLPLELTSFVGRRRELTEARRLLSVARLVTLTGIGGVGKTRLALRVAAETRRVFADGVWVVELGQLQNSSLLAEVVATSLRLRDQSTRAVQDVLAEYLAERRLLLVLDNCEHLIEAVASLATTLLRTCPELRILTTSREQLSIAGEAAMRVPPMTVPDPDRPSLRGLPQYDAVTLFVERAVAAVPEFELNEDNQVAVAQICVRLEGLPLPIELAAVRLRAMTAEEIAKRLADRYRLLTVGNRGMPTRQQTLRLCVDWSYELCTASEQQLWGRLSVFASGFELDAAEGVCAEGLPPDDLLDVVASLVDKSILIREEAGPVVRYRLLETLRDYGREKLQQTGEYPALRRRHRDWYEQLAVRAEADWISSRQLEWIDRLKRELPNLRDALQYSLTEPNEDSAAGLQIATALYPLWWSRGLLAEGRRWLDRALSLRPPWPTAERVKALYADSLLAGVQGDLPAAFALTEQEREITEQLGDAHTGALLAHTAGRLALFGGDLPRAIEHFERALEVFRAEGDLHRQIGALQGLGLASGLLGDTARAASCQEEVLTITESRGESEYRARSVWILALMIWQQGDPGRAVRLLAEGLQLTRMTDDPVGTAWCLQALAWIAADEHHSRRAAVLLGATEALRAVMGTTTVLVPNLRTHQEQCERRARSALGGRAYEAAFRQGQNMSFEDAVAYALDEHPPAPQAAGTAASLTRRERQVAELVAQGLTNKAIAGRLVIAQRTAQGHVEHILTKLGFTSRAQIAAWAAEQSRDRPI
ncbi:protein kinase domain-containing protein [Rhodococcus opacus]|uniref:Protein kinase n=1 Tax=Rhodococcus opacus TaxID=37919 RepID=A0A076ET10_RHOOP|nr:protein kinase [Rhodococcus opacus]AII08283.1 protein kinase [Rhodococcus opacus]